MEEVQNGIMAYRPPLPMRIWLKLGFRYSAHAPRPDDDEARFTIHTVTTCWDWKDRLRILFSGMTRTEVCVETEKLETLKGVRAAAVVLAPRAFFPSGVRKDIAL